MRIKTFDEILSGICDTFDGLISPKKISRSNNNFIYLVFKAVAKAHEVINNACVLLSNKFNPLYCSEDDLLSVANIVGTEKYKGSASGLYINVTNSSMETLNLPAGTYTYELDAETRFSFDVLQLTPISPNQILSYIAMSENVGQFPVTYQSDIKITAAIPFSENLKFSCSDNSSLLGETEESNTEFRNRINSETTRQDTLVELQTKLRNLPYIFDCRIYFNNSMESQQIEGISVPSYYMAVFYSGEPRNDIAKVVAQTSIFPTVKTDDAVTVTYESDVFIGDGYKVHIIPFKKSNYTVRVTYKINTVYTDSQTAQNTINSVLVNNLNKQVHIDYVRENEIYTVLESADIVGTDILNVDLLVNGVEVPYLHVPVSNIPFLSEVTFLEVM